MTKTASEKFRRRTTLSDSAGVATIVRHKDGGALHDLLLRACPPDANGEKSITVLAGALGITPWAIHKWVKNGRVPPRRASRIVDISDGRVTISNFTLFVYS